MAKVCVIHNTEHEQHMMRRLRKLYEADAEVTFIKFAEGFSRQIPNDVTEILWSGGNVTPLRGNQNLQEEAFSFIKNSSLPMLGICYGAQVIARAFDAKVVQLPKPCEGLQPMRIIRHKQAFENKYIATVYKNQHWSLQDLPANFDIIACSAEGIEMFEDKQAYKAGMQFHPEQFTQITDGLMLFAKLRSRIVTSQG